VTWVVVTGTLEWHTNGTVHINMSTMNSVSILTSNSHKMNQEDTNNFLSPLLRFTNDLAHSCTEQCCIIQYTLVVMSK